MIVNNCPAHPEVSGLKAINLQILPPITTSCTQSMDQQRRRGAGGGGGGGGDWRGESSIFAFLFYYFINKVNLIAIACLDFAVKGLHCLKSSLTTKIEA